MAGFNFRKRLCCVCYFAALTFVAYLKCLIFRNKSVLLLVATSTLILDCSSPLPLFSADASFRPHQGMWTTASRAILRTELTNYRGSETSSTRFDRPSPISNPGSPSISPPVWCSQKTQRGRFGIVTLSERKQHGISHRRISPMVPSTELK